MVPAEQKLVPLPGPSRTFLQRSLFIYQMDSDDVVAKGKFLQVRVFGLLNNQCREIDSNAELKGS